MPVSAAKRDSVHVDDVAELRVALEAAEARAAKAEASKAKLRERLALYKERSVNCSTLVQETIELRQQVADADKKAAAATASAKKAAAACRASESRCASAIKERDSSQEALQYLRRKIVQLERETTRAAEERATLRRDVSWLRQRVAELAECEVQLESSEAAKLVFPEVAAYARTEVERQLSLRQAADSGCGCSARRERAPGSPCGPASWGGTVTLDTDRSTEDIGRTVCTQCGSQATSPTRESSPAAATSMAPPPPAAQQQQQCFGSVGPPACASGMQRRRSGTPGGSSLSSRGDLDAHIGRAVRPAAAQLPLKGAGVSSSSSCGYVPPSNLQARGPSTCHDLQQQTALSTQRQGTQAANTKRLHHPEHAPRHTPAAAPLQHNQEQPQQQQQQPQQPQQRGCKRPPGSWPDEAAATDEKRLRGGAGDVHRTLHGQQPGAPSGLGGTISAALPSMPGMIPHDGAASISCGDGNDSCGGDDNNDDDDDDVWQLQPLPTLAPAAPAAPAASAQGVVPGCCSSDAELLRCLQAVRSNNLSVGSTAQQLASAVQARRLAMPLLQQCFSRVLCEAATDAALLPRAAEANKQQQQQQQEVGGVEQQQASTVLGCLAASSGNLQAVHPIESQAEAGLQRLVACAAELSQMLQGQQSKGQQQQQQQHAPTPRDRRGMAAVWPAAMTGCWLLETALLTPGGTWCCCCQQQNNPVCGQAPDSLLAGLARHLTGLAIAALLPPRQQPMATPPPPSSPPLPCPAAAAAAAAAHLLMAAHDVRGLHRCLAELLCAAAAACRAGGEPAASALQSVIAVVTAWPDALQLCSQAAELLSSPPHQQQKQKQQQQQSQQRAQHAEADKDRAQACSLLVIDPGLVALRSCLLQLVAMAANVDCGDNAATMGAARLGALLHDAPLMPTGLARAHALPLMYPPPPPLVLLRELLSLLLSEATGKQCPKLFAGFCSAARLAAVFVPRAALKQELAELGEHGGGVGFGAGSQQLCALLKSLHSIAK